MELPKERERENKKETRRFAREEHSSRDALFSLFLLSLLHIFPFESSFLLGEKQAEDERLVLFYLVVVLVAEDGRKAEEREEE